MAFFNSDFLNNRLFTDTMLTYDYPAEKRGSAPANAGVEYKENGDIILRQWAPNAKSIIVKSWKDRFEMANNGGLFECVIPYDDQATGPRQFTLEIDGTQVLSEYFPIYWTENRAFNYVEIPDVDMTFCMTADIPHGGLTRELIWADSMNAVERCLVYTPAGYMKGTESYPVLYLQNGGTDNEMCWEYSGRMSQTLDRLFYEGKAVPFIAVMCNTMLCEGGKTANPRDRAYEQMLVNNVIPYIDSHYRTRTDKWSRAVAGLSMGAYMTNDIGLWHPELFGSIGAFTASMTTTETWELYERPYPAVIEAAKKNIKSFSDNYKLFFRSTTRQENHFEFFEADDRLCEESGIAALPGYCRIVYPERTSKWSSWRQGLRDMACLLFRE